MEIIGDQSGIDIPQTAATSSVGSIEWPPKPASENRCKGIYGHVVEYANDLIRLIDDFQHLPFNRSISRYSGRLFIRSDILTDLVPEDKIRVGSVLEGIIPLDSTGVPEISDCSLIYIGRNSSHRTNTDNNVNQELDQARIIFSNDSHGSQHDYSGFNFQILGPNEKNDAEIQMQYNDLYQAFGWSPVEVAKILTNENNVLVATFTNNRLISAGIGERAVLRIKRGKRNISFVMYEVTEAATREEYRGNGLYTKVAEVLMYYLSTTDVNLVYAESNLLAPGVLHAAKRQGRQSVLETFDRFNFTPRPLVQHVRISGGINDHRPQTEKNDLLVTFLSRKKLLELYGK